MMELIKLNDMNKNSNENNKCMIFEPHYSCFCQLVKAHDGPHAYFWESKTEKPKKDRRCPYRYISLTSNNFTDNQCMLQEDHKGVHIQRLIIVQPQPIPIEQGWVKIQ